MMQARRETLISILGAATIAPGYVRTFVRLITRFRQTDQPRTTVLWQFQLHPPSSCCRLVDAHHAKRLTWPSADLQSP